MMCPNNETGHETGYETDHETGSASGAELGGKPNADPGWRYLIVKTAVSCASAASSVNDKLFPGRIGLFSLAKNLVLGNSLVMASARTGRNTVKKNDGADSGKLDRTLKDIESAFADWESLGTRKVRNAEEHAEDKRKTKAAEQSAKDFQKRTAKLLDQLCEQLAELGD